MAKLDDMSGIGRDDSSIRGPAWYIPHDECLRFGWAIVWSSFVISESARAIDSTRAHFTWLEIKKYTAMEYRSDPHW